MERKRKSKKQGEDALRSAYERLAFGGIADAVRLLFLENPSPDEIGAMDLFNVAEIRKPRQGGMEIRFVDRIKALESLERLGRKSPGESGLYEALAESARLLREESTPGGAEPADAI